LGLGLSERVRSEVSGQHGINSPPQPQIDGSVAGRKAGGGSATTHSWHSRHHNDGTTGNAMTARGCNDGGTATTAPAATTAPQRARAKLEQKWLRIPILHLIMFDIFYNNIVGNPSSRHPNKK